MDRVTPQISQALSSLGFWEYIFFHTPQLLTYNIKFLKISISPSHPIKLNNQIAETGDVITNAEARSIMI